MLMALGSCDGRRGPAVELYRQRFPNRRHPGVNVFRNLEDRCLTTNALVPGRNIDAGRPRRRNDALLEENVLDLIEEQPTRSKRRVGRQLNLSHTKVWRTLKEDRQHPYHYQQVHQLKENDPANRLEFCEAYIALVQQQPDVAQKILWTDESIFTRDGCFNQHNRHVWAHENPRATRVRGFQDRFSVNVWAGVIGDELIGPHFLPDILNGDAYLQFLQNDLPNLVGRLPDHIRENMIFMQDGAGPHFAVRVREWLNREFPNRWIGRGGPIRWPPRSPDLTPCDFFLWGYLKEQVYKGEPPQFVENLRHRITQACEEIPEGVIGRATSSVVQRVQLAIEKRGCHIEQYL